MITCLTPSKVLGVQRHQWQYKHRVWTRLNSMWSHLSPCLLDADVQFPQRTTFLHIQNKWNPLSQPMNTEGEVKAGCWCPGPEGQVPTRQLLVPHSRGPFWMGTFFPLSKTWIKSCMCMKESIPWPSSPHFSLKCCLSPLSTTLPTKEWYFSLELLSALIGCECLKQLRCSNNCYSCLAPAGETQKLPHELFYLKMIPTCILLQ